MTSSNELRAIVDKLFGFRIEERKGRSITRHFLNYRLHLIAKAYKYPLGSHTLDEINRAIDESLKDMGIQIEKTSLGIRVCRDVEWMYEFSPMQKRLFDFRMWLGFGATRAKLPDGSTTLVLD